MFGVRRIFLKVLALVYLCAFLSWNSQVIGLVGANGILPLSTWLTRIEPMGLARFWFFPQVFWLSSSDFALTAVCWLGVLFSIILLLGFIPRICLVVLWALYFSCVTAGQTFMGFQWESLLLEAGFLSIFLGNPTFMVPKATVYLFRLLLFRLMLMSGLAKLMSHDTSWANLTALRFHFETQPLPTPLAYWAHQLPDWILRMSTGYMFLTELMIPFFFLLPRTFRIIGFWFHTALQIGIMLTGNYTYFNILTLALGLFVIDDIHLSYFMPSSFLKRPLPVTPWKMPLGMEAQIILLSVRKFLKVVGMGAVSIGGFLMILDIFSIALLPQPVNAFLLRNLERYRIVNSYGLFAVMTTTRYELAIEGSHDGETWIEYKFKYKPDDLEKAPSWVAPHQPRLDWQMWFAPLSSWKNHLWLQHLIFRLLSNEPTVTALLRENSFADRPPKWIRIRKFVYKFTSPEEKEKSGRWWSRVYFNEYIPPLSL